MKGLSYLNILTETKMWFRVSQIFCCILDKSAINYAVQRLIGFPVDYFSYLDFSSITLT